MSKYFKNFILCGELDHYCLLCEESLHNLDDLEKHIRWEKHRKSLKVLTPIPKFKREGIFKINERYYCEHCNHIIPTVSAIPNHIEEASHQEAKFNPRVELKSSICKRESGQLAIDKIKLTYKEWNGVVDSRCIFCDVVVVLDNFVKHISTASHMISLIESEILEVEEQYYRKINTDSLYCFLCKKTFLAQSLNDHRAEELHIEKAKAQNETNEDADQAKKIDIAIQLINSQKDYFDIDLVNKVAMCKICTAYVNINFKFMIEHKKTHNITDKNKIEQAPVDMDEVFKSLKLKKIDDLETANSLWFDHGKRRAELAKFGRDHFIKLVFPGAKGYCSLCATYVSAHIKNFIEHVKGQIHMGHLELKGIDKGIKAHVKPTYKTKKFKDFIKVVSHAKELKILWINKEFCLDLFSFMLVSMIDEQDHGERFKCFVCDIIYDDKEHCNTEEHKELIMNTEVITTLNGELVREVRPNLYHCAICNVIFPFWENLEKHLYGWKHVFTKEEKNQILADELVALATLSFNHEKILSYLLNL